MDAGFAEPLFKKPGVAAAEKSGGRAGQSVVREHECHIHAFATRLAMVAVGAVHRSDLKTIEKHGFIDGRIEGDSDGLILLRVYGYMELRVMINYQVRGTG